MFILLSYKNKNHLWYLYHKHWAHIFCKLYLIMEEYKILAYLIPHGSSSYAPRGLLKSLSTNMKEMMRLACEDIPFATFKDDRCEGRIVTDSGGDLRPTYSVNSINPICFKLYSESPMIPANEMRVIRDAIYKQLVCFSGCDVDICIALYE